MSAKPRNHVYIVNVRKDDKSLLVMSKERMEAAKENISKNLKRK